MRSLKPLGSRIISVEEAMRIVEGMPHEYQHQYVALESCATYGLAVLKLRGRSCEELLLHPKEEDKARALTIEETMRGIISNYEWINDHGRTRSIEEREELCKLNFATSSYISFSSESILLGEYHHALGGYDWEGWSDEKKCIPLSVEGLSEGVNITDKPLMNKLFDILVDKHILSTYCDITKKFSKMVPNISIPSHMPEGVYPLVLHDASWGCRISHSKLNHETRFMIRQ